jgi:hypothetical protein
MAMAVRLPGGVLVVALCAVLQGVEGGQAVRVSGGLSFLREAKTAGRWVGNAMHAINEARIRIKQRHAE